MIPMARPPIQSRALVQRLQRNGPARTPDLARDLGTSTVCMRALLSYLARKPRPVVLRVEPGLWKVSSDAAR